MTETNTFLYGKRKIPVDSSESGLDIDVNYFGMHGMHIRVSSTTPVQLQNIPCSVVVIQNPAGNGNVYVDGIGDAAASISRSYIVYPGGDATFPVNNANLLTVIGDNEGEEIRYHVYRNYTAEPTIDYTVTEAPDLEGPTVESTSPLDGATSVPTTTEIYAIFDEDLDPETITNDAVTVSPALTYNVILDPTNHKKVIVLPTESLTISTVYTVTWTDVIQDLTGNAMTDHSISFTTAGAPDTTPPTVSSTFPVHGSTDVPIAIPEIYAIFSETIANSSVTSGSITISPSVAKTNSVDMSDPTKVILAPGAALAVSTLYTVTWTTAIEDLAGNNLASSNIITFTTAAAPDTTPPTISTKTPAVGATNQQITVVPSIVFSEPLSPASVNSTTVILKKTENNEVIPCTVTLSPSNTIIITPSDELIYSKQYSITITGGASGVKDVIGNAFATTDTWVFTTKAATESIIYNVSNDGSSDEISNDNDEYIGTEIVNTSHPLHDKVINKVKVRARKVNSPTGNGQLWVLDSSRNELYQIGANYNVANLTGSSSGSTEMTFEDATNDTPLAVGQFLVFKYDGGDSSNTVRFFINESNIISNSNLIRIPEEGGTVNRKTSFDLAAIIYSYS